MLFLSSVHKGKVRFLHGYEGADAGKFQAAFDFIESGKNSASIARSNKQLGYFIRKDPPAGGSWHRCRSTDRVSYGLVCCNFRINIRIRYDWKRMDLQEA